MRHEDTSWATAFRNLPQDRQGLLRQWFEVQDLIAEVLGLTEEEWLGLVGWALERPGDFAFVQTLATHPTAEGLGRLRDARRMLGETHSLVGVSDGSQAVTTKSSKKGLDQEIFKSFISRSLRG